MSLPRDHHSTYARRDERARAEGFRSYRDKRLHGGSTASRPRNQRELNRLPRAARAKRQRSLRALAEAREGLTLEQAAARNEVSVNTIAYWSGGSVRQDGTVTKSDRLWRPMWAISTKTGSRVGVDVRGSVTASRLSNYWSAVETYLQTGDDTALQAFRGVRIAGVELETDTTVIDRLAVLGQLSFETIYQDVAA